MQTKTQQVEMQKADGLDLDHPFSIPDEIKQKVRERGFYLYEWINEIDFRNSLKKDFFHLLENIGPLFAWIIIIYAGIYVGWLGLTKLLLLPFSIFLMSYAYILGFFALIVICFLAYKTIVTSRVYFKNHQVVLTDSHISLNNTILSLDQSYHAQDDLNSIDRLFHEPIFQKSGLGEQNTRLYKTGIDKIKLGYKKLWKSIIGNRNHGRRSKGWGQMGLLMIVLYTGYIGVIWFVYVFGIAIVYFFGLSVSYLNKLFLLLIGHKVTVISDLFDKILGESLALKRDKKDLQKLLSQAAKNDWQDSLLNQINKGIGNINTNAADSIKVSAKLKKTIESSKYSEMFNFEIYNNWIKTQILEPIIDIKKLLEVNLEILSQTKNEITQQITTTTQPSLSSPLRLQQTRIVYQMEQIKSTLRLLETYIQKLN